MTPVAEVLREARALIVRGWTKHVLARDGWGEPTSPEDPDAICFCAAGAIVRAAKEGDYIPAHLALAKATGWGVTCWNDSRSDVSEVLAAFDKAIEMAEASNA